MAAEDFSNFGYFLKGWIYLPYKLPILREGKMNG